ncbi:MAG: tyrosine-type recombinase/integrase [Clostridia bacterium]|nr:tyrosine-type recombinase/integrase [Clostridia bacterium]MBQ9657296.1 tyrosine-type recombinase/integrase [Clostridia bacterium]
MVVGRETFRKIITSPEIIEQINPKNMQLVLRFLKNFATKRSPKSVVNYKSNLSIFFCWNVLYNDNIFFIDIKKLDLMDFFDFCVTELKWGSSRFAQMHSCLSSFSAFVENYYDDCYPDFRNLLPKIEKLPKETVRKKSVFTKKELDSLMNKLGKEDRIQEQCLLALMMSSGSRASELARFTTDIIDENSTAFEGLFLETTDEIQVKGRGVKGKSLIRYILKDTFLPYYQKWLPIREKIMKENKKVHNYIFITQSGDPASVSTFRGWVERWNKFVEKPFYIHSIRHYYTTSLLAIGLEQDLVQSIIGWTSLDMVNIYNDMTAKDRKWKGLDKLKVALENDNVK